MRRSTAISLPTFSQYGLYILSLFCPKKRRLRTNNLTASDKKSEAVGFFLLDMAAEKGVFAVRKAQPKKNRKNRKNAMNGIRDKHETIATLCVCFLHNVVGRFQTIV